MKARVSYRQIAKMLVRALPLNDDELADKVEEYAKAIEAMPEEARLALKSAYIFSSKVPPEEREDVFQELALRTIEAFRDGKQYTDATVNENFAYAVARCDWLDWHKSKARREKHLAGSLNEVTVEKDGNEVELIDTLIGEADFEDKAIAKLEAQRIWDELPDKIKPIIRKRLQGEPILKKEACILYRYRKKYGHSLRELTRA